MRADFGEGDCVTWDSKVDKFNDRRQHCLDTLAKAKGGAEVVVAFMAFLQEDCSARDKVMVSAAAAGEQFFGPWNQALRSVEETPKYIKKMLTRLKLVFTTYS